MAAMLLQRLPEGASVCPSVRLLRCQSITDDWGGGGTADDVTAAVKHPFDNQMCQRYHLMYPDILSECFCNNWLMTVSVRLAAVMECEKKK